MVAGRGDAGQRWAHSGWSMVSAQRERRPLARLHIAPAWIPPFPVECGCLPLALALKDLAGQPIHSAWLE